MPSLEGLKTQIAALIVIVIGALQMFGIVLDSDQQEALQLILVGVVFFALRLMTKGPAKPLTDILKRE